MKPFALYFYIVAVFCFAIAIKHSAWPPLLGTVVFVLIGYYGEPNQHYLTINDRTTTFIIMPDGITIHSIKRD